MLIFAFITTSKDKTFQLQQQVSKKQQIEKFLLFVTYNIMV